MKIVSHTSDFIHRLFFAIRLDHASAVAAAALGAKLHSRRLQAEDRLHITLHWLRDHASLPAELVTVAMAAGGRVDMAPFDVVFDRAETLHGPQEVGPLVLKGSTGLIALRRFQRALGDAMRDAGIGHLARSTFKPHVTLAYAGRAIDTQAIDPIRWTVKEFFLIHSVLGESKHIVLGRWPLCVRQLDLC